ncbi:hypothetical protein HYDPIDRAFT_107633 [Hydnomerulius pinastri MD-312]|nr:hypothetical protein HYDPIDRAFT_107633 [Hydnomerulius pinastri MD-312]
MTEYDYSPAAYERYIAQQTRVSNWVDHTTQQAHAYSNPFVLSPTLRDRAFYDESDQRTVTSGGRPAPTRSKTLHGQGHFDQRSTGSSSRPSRSRSKSHSEHQRQYDYEREQRPSRHRSHSHSRSSSTQKSVQIIYQPPRPHTSQPYGAHVISPTPVPTYRTPASGIHTSPGQAIYQYPTGHGHSSSRPIYLNTPPPGQIYQIPRGNQPYTMSREQLHRGPSQTRHSSKVPPQPYLLVQGGGPRAEYKRGPQIHAPVPTKPQGQPLLKRLLGFVTMSPVSGRSSNGRGTRRTSY